MRNRIRNPCRGPAVRFLTIDCEGDSRLGNPGVMQLQEMSSARLRALTGVEIPHGRVISLYVDLDPSQFGTAPARQSAIRSSLDGLGRNIEELAGDLTHDELMGLREDHARIEEALGDLDASGARGLAIFACGPAGLFEVVRLPHSVELEATLDTVPRIEQLAGHLDAPVWGVVLISRRHGRILRGGPHGLVEVVQRDDQVHGQHRQGGWSHPRYERSIDREADAHVEAVVNELSRVHRRRPFRHLLFVTHGELWPAIEQSLHGDLVPLVRGRVESEVEYAGPEDVLAAARPEMERADAEHQRELMASLAERLGRGERGAAGVQPTLDALLQGRVETLLLLEGFAAAGVSCPACGWMGADADTGSCPVDGDALDRHENVVDVAVASALGQDADVTVVRRRDDPADPDAGPGSAFLQLQGDGGMAALLRF